MSCDMRGAFPAGLEPLRSVRMLAQRSSERRLGRVGQAGLAINLSVLYFLGSSLAIATISVYDAYLVMLYRSVILSVEQNPLCAMLIAWDPHDLSFFLVGKALGTLTVLGSLLALYCWRRRWALSAVTGVTVFQLALLLYLNIAEH